MNTPIIGEEKDKAKEEKDSIFDDKKHYPIFPTGLFQFKLAEKDQKDVDENIVPALNDLASKQEKPNWAVQPKPEEKPELKNLADLFTEATVEVLGFGGVIYGKLQITALTVWGANQPQLFPQEPRPNNLLAGVFVAKTNDDGRLTFLDPRPQAWVIKPPVKEPSIYNSDAFSVDLKQSQMLVFPAWMQYHMAFKEKMEENIWVTWTAMIQGGPRK